MKGLEKTNRFVFGVFTPLLAAAALTFILLVPSSFPIDSDYSLAGSGEESILRENAGRVLAGPGIVRIGGKYPWLFGTAGKKGEPPRTFFILNLKKKEFRSFSAAEAARPGNEFSGFLARNNFSLDQCFSWDELYHHPDGKKRRRQLKESMERPLKEKKSFFF